MYLLYVCLGTMCVPGACWKPDEGMGFLRIAVIDGWGLPCRCWELNLDLLEQQLLSHISSPTCVHSYIHLVNIYECLLYAKHWSQALEINNI